MRHYHDPGRLSGPAGRGQGLLPPDRFVRDKFLPQSSGSPGEGLRSSRSFMPAATAASISAIASSRPSFRRRYRIFGRRANSLGSRFAKSSTSTPRRRNAPRSAEASWRAPRVVPMTGRDVPPDRGLRRLLPTDGYADHIDAIAPRLLHQLKAFILAIAPPLVHQLGPIQADY